MHCLPMKKLVGNSASQSQVLSLQVVLNVVQEDQAAKSMKGAQQKAVERYWSLKILNPCLEQFDELRDRSDRLTSDKPDSGVSKTNKSLEINRH